MREEKRNIVLNKGCHSRKLLSGIYNVCSYVSEHQTTCVEDPRLQASGMTAYPNVGQALPDNRKYIVENNSCVVGPEQQLLRTSALLTKLSGHALTYREGSPSPLVGEGARRAGEGFPRGFTLIELLVVVLIIGILAAVALPQYRLAVEKTRTKRMILFMHTIDQAQKVHYLSHTKYSETFSALDFAVPTAWLVNASRIKNKIFDCYFWIPNAGQGATSLLCRAVGAQGVPEIEKYFGGKDWRCIAANNNTIQTKICKSLANSTSPNNQGTKTTYYFTLGEK